MALSPHPLVSFVMPAWNTPDEWLGEAVRSVLGQVGANVELNVVDDGSDRPVERVLGDVGDPRLRVLRTPHVGAAEARNAGFRASRGDFVRFVDSDDSVPADSTAHLLQLLGDGTPTIAYGATLYCDPALRPLRVLVSDLRGDVEDACLFGRFAVRGPALLFPRAVVESAGLWDGFAAPCEDWDFVLRALEHAPVRGDHTVVYRYRKHETSLTGSMDAVERGAHRVIDRYLERHPEAAGTRRERRARAAAVLVGAAMRRDAVRPYGRRLIRAAALDPAAAARELTQGVRFGAHRLARKLPGRRQGGRTRER
jgi:O-antigen biosynthesis protein